MTNPHTLIPSTRSNAPSNVGAGARPRVVRASSLVLCALGLLGAVACGDNTGDDVIQPARSGSERNEPTPVTRDGANTSVDEDGPAIATGVTGDDDDVDDESGLDDEDEITGRSGGTRSTGGGGGGRRRDNDNDDDEEEIESDAGVVDAGDAGVVVEEDAGIVVEEDAGGVVEEDAGLVDAG